MRTDNLIIEGKRMTADMDKINAIEHILDINGNIHANTVQTNVPIQASSGGTGISSYEPGDMLVAGIQGLEKITKSTIPGDMLIVGDDGVVKWDTHVLRTYTQIGSIAQTGGTINIEYAAIRRQNTYIYEEEIKTEFNNMDSYLSIAIIHPSPTSTTIETTYSFQKGDSITVLDQTRLIVDSTTNSILVDSPFTLLNLWTLTGSTISNTQFRFGTRSLASTSTTTFATLTTRKPIETQFTIEFFFRVTSTVNMSIIASNQANTIAINKPNTSRITLSLGTGVSFNIMNAVSMATAISSNTWYHLALCFDGSTYRTFINGNIVNTTTSTVNIPTSAFTSMKIGGGASTYAGFIDEFRISNVSRYSNNFTIQAAQFTKDVNTISLNHFENSDITLADECSDITNTFEAHVNTVPVDGQVLQVNVRTKKVSPRWTMYGIPAWFIMQQGTPRVCYWGAGYQMFQTHIPIVTNSTNTTLTNVDLMRYIPQQATTIKILITHIHVGAVQCSIAIGNIFNQYLPMSAAGTQQMIADVHVQNRTIAAALSAVASTTSFSIRLMGFAW